MAAAVVSGCLLLAVGVVIAAVLISTSLDDIAQEIRDFLEEDDA